MTGVLSKPPNHCPSHDGTKPYPNLKYPYRNCQRSKRYGKLSRVQSSHICCGGFHNKDNDFIQSSIELWYSAQTTTDIVQRRHSTSKTCSQETELPELRWCNDTRKGQQGIATVVSFTSLNSYFEKVADGIQLSVEDKMVYEALRLQSFHRVDIGHSTVSLARCGFFATGNENETKCYSCGIIYNNWRRTDDPHLIHSRVSPTCRHVNGTDCRNIPLSRPSAPTVQEAAECFGYGRATPAEPSDNMSEAIATPQILASNNSTENGSCHASENIILKETEIVTDSAAAATPDDDDFTGFPVSSDRVSLSSRSTLHFEKAVYPHYSNIKTRLESFQFWPRDHCKTPAELVYVGFFYAGYADCVRCFVCGVGLRTWEEGDDPWAEHIRWRSSCDFVSKVKGQGYVIQILATLGRQLTEANQQNDQQTETCRGLAAGINKLSVEEASQEVPKLHEQPSLQLSGQLTHDFTPLSERTITPEDTPGDDGVTAADNSASTQYNTDNTDNKGQTAETRLVTKRKMDSERNEPLSLQAAEEENRQIRESSLCKICLDEMANIVFLPCGHLIACVTCSPALERCPLCRQHIRGTVRVHLATMTSLKSTI